MLADNCSLSLGADIQPLLWVVVWVSYVKTTGEPTGSCNWYISSNTTLHVIRSARDHIWLYLLREAGDYCRKRVALSALADRFYNLLLDSSTDYCLYFC
jgi:hypothetical protein